MEPANPAMIQQAWLLSLAGFLPFAFLALAVFLMGEAHPMHDYLVDGFRVYAAVILSFLGGTRWGMGLSGAEGGRYILAASVIPAIVAWAAMLVPAVPGTVVVLFAFCAQGAWDSVTYHARPGLVWFARLRIVLTLLVAAAHLLILLSMA